MGSVEPDQESLMNEAIDLVIRLQSNPENPVSIEMIRAWRARGSEYEKAWARVSKIHGAAGRVLTDQRTGDDHKTLGMTRRNLMIGGAVGLAALGTGYAFLPGASIQARADHITAKGEIRRVALPDGSIATIGPSSAIALEMTPERRGIELLAGLAFFKVVPDTQRPFSVRTADLTATALGTAFEVSNEAGFLAVSVERGAVEAQVPHSAPVTDARLEAGEWITFDRSSQRIDRGKSEAGQVAAWRDNLLIAEREPVSALVARIGRWLPGRIVLADPFIGSQRVSGVFDLNNPDLALEAVVHPTGARVRRMSSALTVISPI